MTEPSAMIFKCGKCGHVQVGAILPMEMAKVGRLLRKAYCVNCGADSRKLFLASKDEAKPILEALRR
jgi:ribosomal protein S27AE